jgi:hypothetical protein
MDMAVGNRNESSAKEKVKVKVIDRLKQNKPVTKIGNWCTRVNVNEGVQSRPN